MIDIKTCVALGALALAGCDESEAQPAPKKTAPVAAPTASAPAPAKTNTAPSKPPRPAKLDTELTDARREKIEKAHPEAKGFVLAKDMEDKLKAQKKVDEKEAGIRAFDAMAKGKWVLFTGPMVEAKDDGFSMGITYTPRAEHDPMGLSRQFFLVAISDVKGFDAETMKSGTQVAVLAKYDGKAKAGPAFELVAEDNW